MFTKWYRMIQRGRIGYNSVYGIKNINGTTFTYYGSNQASRGIYELALGYALRYALLEERFTISGYPCVSFGSGLTTPTEEDYRLENFLTGVTYTVGSINETYGDTQDVFSNTFMITNKNAESITVSEAGIFAPAPYSSSGSSNVYYTMLNRIVFDTPVTIPAGESATVKYDIVVNY